VFLFRSFFAVKAHTNGLGRAIYRAGDAQYCLAAESVGSLCGCLFHCTQVAHHRITSTSPAGVACDTLSSDSSACNAVLNDHNTKTNTGRSVQIRGDMFRKVLQGTRLSLASRPSVRSVDLYLKDSDDADATR
jgi:hypothetical protein